MRRAERLAHDPLDQVALLVGGVADDRRARSPAGLQPGGGFLDRLGPLDLGAAAQPRAGDALLGAEHLEPVAAAVAEPAVVDVGVVAGDDPLHLLVADVKLTLHWLGQSVQTEPEFSMSQGRARNRYV